MLKIGVSCINCGQSAGEHSVRHGGMCMTPDGSTYYEGVAVEKKYVVPEGMLEAASNGWSPVQDNALRTRLEAALKWLAENPILPDEKQIANMGKFGMEYWLVRTICRRWIEDMFLAPEPEVPEAIADLMRDKDGRTVNVREKHLMIAAYARGREYVSE